MVHRGAHGVILLYANFIRSLVGHRGWDHSQISSTSFNTGVTEWAFQEPKPQGFPMRSTTTGCSHNLPLLLPTSWKICWFVDSCLLETHCVGTRSALSVAQWPPRHLYRSPRHRCGRNGTCATWEARSLPEKPWTSELDWLVDVGCL